MKHLAAIALLGLWAGAAGAQVFCQAQTVPLIAWGSTPVGTVTVSDKSKTLFVTYQTTGGFVLNEVRLAYATSLAGIPQGSQGPALDKFPFAACLSPAATSYTFATPLPAGAGFGTPLYVVAFAVVSSGGTQQTAWGAGLPFPGSPACTGGGGGDDADDDHPDGGDSAHVSIGPTHHGDHPEGDHEGDHEGGHKTCGLCPSSSDHHSGDLARRGGSAWHPSHSDDGHHHGDDHPDSDDDDDNGGKGCAPCSANYFVYLVNCTIE